VAALARDAGHEYVVFTDEPDAFGRDVRAVHVRLRSVYHQLVWDDVGLPALIARHQVALYHGTKNVLPRRLGVPGVVTVHDLAVYTHPDTFALPQRWHFRLTVPSSVRRAARIVAVSEHTRRDLAERLSVPAERIAVVPNGVADVYHESPAAAHVAAFRRDRGLGARLVACVGTIQPRKRVERVIDAFVLAGLAERGWELAIAGRVRPGYRPAWLAARPPGVHWLGTLPADTLPLLYAASAIAVSGSEYEGFGLTVAEAMACGCATIAVATSSIPEVVGDAALLVERSDARLLAEALDRLARDDAARAALAARGRTRAARFRWSDTAARTRAVYDEVLRCPRA
jgi:glycosyltransferase involved in cell wall biosynthesis